MAILCSFELSCPALFSLRHGLSRRTFRRRFLLKRRSAIWAGSAWRRGIPASSSSPTPAETRSKSQTSEENSLSLDPCLCSLRTSVAQKNQRPADHQINRAPSKSKIKPPHPHRNKPSNPPGRLTLHASPPSPLPGRQRIKLLRRRAGNLGPPFVGVPCMFKVIQLVACGKFT